MGDPSDKDRGIGPLRRGTLGNMLPEEPPTPFGTNTVTFGVLYNKGLQPCLLSKISQSFKSDNVELKLMARKDAVSGFHLLKMITKHRWKSDEDRWIYTRYFYTFTADGETKPDRDVILSQMLQFEEEYQNYLKKQAGEAELFRQKSKHEAELSRVRAVAESLPMSPLTEFEPEMFPIPLKQAQEHPMWVERDILDSRVSRVKEPQAIKIFYKDGGVLEIPLKVIDNKSLPESAAVLYFRRHKSTGRIVPFQILVEEYRRLADTADPKVLIGDTYNAIPPRFDPVLTPHILTWYEIANLDWMGQQFNALKQGFGAIATAGSFTQISPNALANVTGSAAGTAGKVAVGTAGLARAALMEVRVTVTRYGFSRVAAEYLGRSAWTFYLQNAVTASLTAGVGAELAFSLADQDMGPVSPSDSLIFAIQVEKNAPQAFREWEIIEAKVHDVEEATHTAKATVTNTKPATAQDAEKYFDSGKLILHEKGPGQAAAKDLTNDSKVVAKAVDDRSTGQAARATADNGVAKIARGKGKLAQLKPMLPSYNINLREILSEPEVEKLIEKGFKREALEKLRQMEIGALERAGLMKGRDKDYEGLHKIQVKISQAEALQKEEELSRLREAESKLIQKIAFKEEEAISLYKKLQASANSKGGAVKDFINEFYKSPGFEEVVLSWAKGGISQRGTNHLMKYALAKYKGRPIRFEWPVGMSRTLDGEEGSRAARYVDIVVDRETDIRLGEAQRIEMKSWQDRYLKYLRGEFEEKKIAQLEGAIVQNRKDIARLQQATARNEKEIAQLEQTVGQTEKEIARLQKAIANRRKGTVQQLVRDTAFFTPNNIKWVFDSNRTTKEEVVKTFMEIIKRDPFLKKHWGETDEEILATLERVIEMFL